jgi:hypothetical protein
LRGHQSIDTCLKYLDKCQDEKLENVIICHLSDSNARHDNFIDRVKEVCSCPCFVAKKDIVVNLSLIPF